MIEELDEVLRRLLTRELPVKNGEVNIEFHQPKREWSARLSRPTLNLFLHELHENNTLRQTEWQIKRNGDGTATKKRTPVRMDLHYIITAWAAEIEDEHSLLSRTLLALFRHPTLPDELLTENLRDQPMPIPLRVAEPDALRSPADIWSAMDNELKPVITCTVTLALNPYQPLIGPVVKTRDLRFGQIDQGQSHDRFWMVGGRLRGADRFGNVHLKLVERGLDVTVAANGEFIIGNLESGVYTLAISTPERELPAHQLVVPSPAYDIELGGGT